MAFDEDSDDERPRRDTPLPPEDRLWRHPSEVGRPATGAATTATVPPGPGRRGRIGAALVGATLAGAVVATAVMWVTRPTKVVVTQATAPPATVASFAPAPLPTEDLAADLAPSLIAIDVQQGDAWSTGTGIWLDDDGTVAVAAPLVSGTTAFLVTRPDGTRESAQLVATDASTGMSVLQVPKTSGAVFGHTAAPPRAGRAVAVVGAPTTATGGDLAQRVSTATVSAAGLRLTVDGAVLHDAFQLDRAVPDDAVGSVVVDGEGAVLGIVLIARGSDDLAVVAPASGALDAARALRDEREVRQGRLGVEAIDLDPDVAGMLEVPGGARVTEVEAGSAAATAGLEVDDVVVSIDDRTIAGASDLVMALRTADPGTSVELSWRRGEQLRTATVRLS